MLVVARLTLKWQRTTKRFGLWYQNTCAANSARYNGSNSVDVVRSSGRAASGSSASKSRSTTANNNKNIIFSSVFCYTLAARRDVLGSVCVCVCASTNILFTLTRYGAAGAWDGSTPPFGTLFRFAWWCHYALIHFSCIYIVRPLYYATTWNNIPEPLPTSYRIFGWHVWVCVLQTLFPCSIYIYSFHTWNEGYVWMCELRARVCVCWRKLLSSEFFILFSVDGWISVALACCASDIQQCAKWFFMRCVLCLSFYPRRLFSSSPPFAECVASCESGAERGKNKFKKINKNK